MNALDGTISGRIFGAETAGARHYLIVASDYDRFRKSLKMPVTCHNLC